MIYTLISILAVYGDTRILPMIWVPSSLQTMKERFDQQKENVGYKVKVFNYNISIKDSFFIKFLVHGYSLLYLKILNHFLYSR